MKRITKRILAAVCALALVAGSGFAISGYASDNTARKEQTEWILYSGSKDFEIHETGDMVVQVSEANVNLPDVLGKKDLSMSVTFTIPNEDVLTSLKDGVIELAQDVCDVGELSWDFKQQNLQVGENVIELKFTDGLDTGGGVSLDIHETINWFRIYTMTSSKGSVATLKEVKLSDIRTAGMTFGEKKTSDTYLQLTKPLHSTPQSIEASVKMDYVDTTNISWLLRAGSETTTTSGHTLTTGVTTETDAPGAGMTYSIWDATNGDQTFEMQNASLSIDASAYDKSKLAVAFWVYASENGTLTNSGDNQMRLSSSKEGIGANFIYYPLQHVSVSKGWNYIELPLDTWKEIAGQPLNLGDIRRVGFTPFMLSTGSVRYIGDIKLVVMQEPEQEPGGDTSDDGVKWTLRAGGDTTIWGMGSGHTLSTGTTTEGAAPGAGKKYTVLDASSKAVSGFSTRNTNLGINASEYGMSELAVAFWVYADKAGVLGTGDQIRISSAEYVGSDALIYYFSDITLDAGWNYIQLPLDKWKTDIKQNFTLSNIRTFGFSGYNLAAGNIRYFGDFELIVIPPQTEWILRAGNDTSIWGIGSGPALTTGTTTANDASGAGMNYTIIDTSNQAMTNFSTRNSGLGINVSDYTMNEIAVAFWVYADKAGTLGTGDQMRIGSADYLGSDALIYYYNNIQVEAGWNYIELPLNEWKTDIKGNFTLSNIKTFGFTTYNLAKGNLRYFGDFKLVVKLAEPIESEVLRPGSDTTSSSGHTITTGTTAKGEKPGAQKTYSILDASGASISGFGTFNGNLGINASASELSDLAVTFWVYSNQAGTLGKGDQFRIGSGPYLSGNALIYYFSDIQVEAGWNYIKLPLNTWKTDIKQGFTLTNIDVFGFTGYNLEEGQIRYFTDIKLVNTKLVEDEIADVYVDVTKNVTTLADNYMIFSNTNGENEENPYALFVTADGYPSLLYGTTQFTLTQNVRTGEWVDIAAVLDESGFVTFYIDGEAQGKSDIPVEKLDAPITAHCIGADGAGKQVMDGTLADIRVWSDERTEKEIAENLVVKDAGVFDNGLDADEEGLMGSWFLVGNIQNVLETLPDSSTNNNTAVYRGSRADDWIDYEIPEEIGKDYWSIIFVPDIQNLIRTNEYNKTWEAIGQWIADNADTENIQHVIGAGDSSWNATEIEFNRAMEGFDRFNDLVPTNVIIGNHDYQPIVTERVSTMYQEYFGEEAIEASAAATTYAGYFDDPAGKSTTENSYYRFSINGTKWMILQLEYHPRVSVMEWAREIVEAHPDDNVIVTTHAYIDGYGEYASNTYEEYTQGDANAGGSIGDTSEAMWSEYLNEYTNIKMILCGHRHNGTGSVVERIETNVAGEEVPALMINAQDVDAGDGSTNIKEQAYYDDKPIGMLGILRFSADGKNVALQYYAPTSEKSFSPEDPFGNEDSNNLKYTIRVEKCVHQGTMIKVNEDKATGSTNGYTGDDYCEDCETMVATGSIIPATGEEPSEEQQPEQDVVQDDTEKDEVETPDSPKTGDRANLFVWLGVFVGAAIVAYSVIMKYRKEEE